ncbi:NAD(P)-dependent oxidoreductase [Mangrovicoccus algicola]|uniref:NAD(P)-dependent oxidoreductase n=1 Tax=Mangrovicoccus algicola TaxID=2771008 RepID=A0A8J6YYP1_9RHOB|nr:NAD(P)-dependent oxidoreductase [Mangrovicoccus algicola]MBE3638436.1 NAD(P)-dependent oxidoreductase [Mangrovicoccus algicola]
MSGEERIGFIGLGPMGHGMAVNLLKAGHPLAVKGNRSRAPVDDLVAQGATEAASPKAMAESCDIIHLCLSNSDQVEAVIRGPEGILASGRSGLVVIDCTTSNPVSTAELAAEMEAAGMVLVDAPLGRTPKEAAAGTLDAMVGAAPEVFARVRPVIECWAGNITHVGPTGAGHKMKLIMNFISMGYAALYGEAVVLGAKVGLPPETVRQVIGGSRLSNGFFETFMKYAVDRDRNAHVFAIANASKDVRYAAAMASDAGVANILGAAIKHYFTHAEAIGRGGDYVPMMTDIIGALNGMDMEAEAAKR